MMMPNELYSKKGIVIDVKEKTFTLEQIKEAQLLFLTYYYTDSYDKDEDVDIFGKFLSEDYYPGMKLYIVKFWIKGYYDTMLDDNYSDLWRSCIIDDKEAEKIKNMSCVKFNKYTSNVIDVISNTELYNDLHKLFRKE